ncbi:molybdopterin synthase sulfur carrier subunit [Granulicella pectinivorans]|jgi:molybdopterin converting factor subunit 1|uniref:Molybdopterin synthase sulfur carrier subunit n=1 Tax=Granulicella pectinivorans TaxID=474950 RepID=A0A1I6M7C4_9BACT|nr:MoaD/ThiS family protein [Granulicella pectinivorans]SFS11609.1 molybdopterin synthase sulfur carrier subunit [Granulicella pectinivorans]
MRVTVLYFGVLKDLFTGDRSTLELAEGETVGGLLRLSEKNASKHSVVWRALAVAVNREYVGVDHALQEGDEVALLPPVSGGTA